MTPDMLDALTGLYLSSATRGARAPRTFRLDSDGATLTVRVPAPAVLAEVEGLLPGPGAGIYRTGTAGLASASGAPLSWSTRDLADRLVERLAALPDRPGAGPAYGALRTLCRESTRYAAEYALDVVKAWRRSLPKVPEPEVEKAEPRVRQYPKDETARKAERRERYRLQEEESSRYFFEGWRAHGWAEDEDGEPVEAPPAPGARAYAAALLARAVGVLEALVDAEETVDEAEEIPARVPGPRRFYGVGDEVLGRRKKTEDGRAYWTVPDMKEDDVTLYTDEEIREALEVREIVARLREQRDRLQARPAATGTDGAVVDLEERRRSR